MKQHKPSVIFLTWQRASQGWNLGILSRALLHSFSLPVLLLLANEKTHDSNLLLQANLTQTDLLFRQVKRSIVAVEDFCGQQSRAVMTAMWELQSVEHPLRDASPQDAQHQSVAIYYTMPKSVQTQLDASCTLHLFSYPSISREVYPSCKELQIAAAGRCRASSA